MGKQMFSRSLGRALAATLGAILWAPAAFSQPAAAPGPWAKVPALPTACYLTQDQYFEQNDAAQAAIQKDHHRQDDINSAINQKMKDALKANPMLMAQALQQKMMEDPQNAQKYMEQMLQQGQAAQTGVLPAEIEKEKQIEAEGEALIKQYQAALAKALAPGNARWTALKKKYGLDDDASHPGELGVADWVWAEWGVILREWDQGYKANCAQWWTATGPMHAYMKRYKDFLVQERIPYEKKAIDDLWLDQHAMLGVSTAGYRTTTDYEAAEDYLKMARNLFDERNHAPRCSSPSCD
jgi:hypothetical protein